MLLGWHVRFLNDLCTDNSVTKLLRTGGGGKKKIKNKQHQTSGFPWLGEARRGCLHLSELQKNSHLSLKASYKKKKKINKKAILSEGQLWRHQHCWPFLTWDLSHKVNRSDYQLMNNTTPRLNFKEHFSPLQSFNENTGSSKPHWICLRKSNLF